MGYDYNLEQNVYFVQMVDNNGYLTTDYQIYLSGEDTISAFYLNGWYGERAGNFTGTLAGNLAGNLTETPSG